MEKDESILVELRQRYGDRDWFYDAGYDQYGRPVVYVKYENHETNYEIPDRIAGKQLLVHFADSVRAKKENFFGNPSGNGISTLPAYTPTPKIATVVKAPEPVIPDVIAELVDTEEQERELELSVRALTDELDRLEKLCGTHILQEIFYEVHDGPNKVTNMSARYPVVQQGVKKLYDKYGFDTIYEELDG
jgi:hypothetical protein